jgi:hypothetical protein
MPPVRSVCVFCGSSSRVDEAYRSTATRLGEELAARGIQLVYGGGRVGLMGLLADAALARGGRVVGVIPRFLVDLEVAHHGVTELRVVDDMHQRKRLMAELADGFLVLPGGFGTVEEAIEVITWKQLGLHQKPVVFVDERGYWRPLRALVEHMIGEGFAHPDHASLFATVDSLAAAFDALAASAPGSGRADLKWV